LQINGSACKKIACEVSLIGGNTVNPSPHNIMGHYTITIKIRIQYCRRQGLKIILSFKV